MHYVTSHRCHNAISVRCEHALAAFSSMNTTPMAHEGKEALLYGNDFWDSKLGPEFKRLPLQSKLHLAYTLLAYLSLSFAAFLEFCFTTSIPEVRQRAGNFMKWNGTALSDDAKFAPGMVFRAWHRHFPKSSPHLNDSVKPFILKVIIEESDKVIQEPTFKINLRAITMNGIRTLLNPANVATKLQEIAPWMWSILQAFSASPNRYRKYELRVDDDSDSDSDKEDIDLSVPKMGLFDEHEPAGERAEGLEKPPGFARNPYHVDIVHSLVLYYAYMQLQCMIACICMLAFVKNSGTNVLPLVLGLFFKINGTSSRVLHMLSNIGLTVSERSVERLKEQISKEAIEQAVTYAHSGGLFFFLFDNLNFYLRKFQQRIMNKNRMLNVTNAAIIAIDPDGIDIEKAQDLQAKLDLRGKRSTASFQEDILPQKVDSEEIGRAFQAHIALFIIQFCPDSKKWVNRSEMVEEIQRNIPEVCVVFVFSIHSLYVS